MHVVHQMLDTVSMARDGEAQDLEPIGDGYEVLRSVKMCCTVTLYCHNLLHES